MKLHFEDLWELAEKSHQNKEAQIIIDDILLKINLYKSLRDSGSNEEEKNKIRSHLFGEILFALSSLSLNENIDVFSALAIAMNYNLNRQ